MVNGTKRSDLSCETNVAALGLKNIYFELKSDEVTNNKKENCKLRVHFWVKCLIMQVIPSCYSSQARRRSLLVTVTVRYHSDL